MRGFDEPWQEDTSPERRLLVEVLVDAIDCARGIADRLRVHERVDAQRWLQSDDAGDAFTFVGLCHALDLDPDAVRARVPTLPEGYSASRAMHREYQRGGFPGRIDDAEVWKDPRWAGTELAPRPKVLRATVCAERRAAVRRMLAEGLLLGEMAARLGVSRPTIADHVRAIERADGPLFCGCGQRLLHRSWCTVRRQRGMAAREAIAVPPPRVTRIVPRLSEDERATVVRLAQTGLSARAIAERLRLNPTAVLRLLRRLVVRCPCGRPLLHHGSCADRLYALQAYA